MKRGSLGSWLAVALGAIYFLAPLIATFEFSLRLKRDEYSFEAYRLVFASGNFQAAFLYSATLALATIAVALSIVVPTAYWVQLRLPRLRGLVEYITLLPLVVPAIVLVFGFSLGFGLAAVCLGASTTMSGSDVAPVLAGGVVCDSAALPRPPSRSEAAPEATQRGFVKADMVPIPIRPRADSSSTNFGRPAVDRRRTDFD